MALENVNSNSEIPLDTLSLEDMAMSHIEMNYVDSNIILFEVINATSYQLGKQKAGEVLFPNSAKLNVIANNTSKG